MHAYMHVYTHVYTHVYMYVYTHVYMHVYTYVATHMSAHILAQFFPWYAFPATPERYSFTDLTSVHINWDPNSTIGYPDDTEHTWTSPTGTCTDMRVSDMRCGHVLGMCGAVILSPGTHT